MKTKDLTQKKLYRELTLNDADRAMIDDENRTVVLSFSSDEPYERDFGVEILDHGEASVDLERLRTSGPLLVNHNWDDVVGVIESVERADGRCSAVVRFGQSERAREIFQDVKDGIRKSVSVGYQIKKIEKEATREDNVPIFRVTDWMPFEVSLVSVPADTTVGVGRSDDDQTETEAVSEQETPVVTVKENKTMSEDKNIDLQKERQSAVQAERDRINGIEGMARKVEHILPEAVQMAADFKNTDRSVAEFNQAVVDKIQNIERESLAGEMKTVDMTPKEEESYSLIRALRAQASGDYRDAGLELEVSRDLEKQYGSTARGLYVPLQYLVRADTTSTEAGDVIGTDHMASMFIDRLRDRSVVLQAGAQMLPGLVGDVDIPRLSSGADFAWIDNESYTGSAETQIAIDDVNLSPHTLRGRVALTRKLLKQSAPSVENIVRQDMLKGIAQTFDKTALVGVTGASQPSGVIWNASVNDPFTGVGESLSWATVVGLESAVNADNADLGSGAYITNSKVVGAAKQAIKATGGTAGFIYEGGQMNGYPVFATNAIPSTFTSGASNSNTGGALSALIFGHWDQMFLGMWGGIDVELDKTTLGDRGAVVMRCFLDGDIALRHPESFAYAHNISA